MKNIIVTFILIFVGSCNAGVENDVNAKDLISKKYFVKNMTCVGCIIGVKTALDNSEKLIIAKKEINVGEMILKFKKTNYDESATDCDVTKAIESSTDFKVFLDKEHKKRSCQIQRSK